MEKKNLVRLIDEIFFPIGFKRKGNNWVLNEDILTKIFNLQKSNFSNLFYINYGYIIRKLELTTRMHVHNGLGSLDKSENDKISNLLDFNFPMDKGKRLTELKSIIIDKIVPKFKTIHTEEDLLEEIKRRPILNDIPLVVKRHFNLI